MSTAIYAHAAIGIEVDIDKVVPNRKVRKCQCRKKVAEDMKFCPSCGYKAWENAEDPIDGLKGEDGTYSTLFGIPVICISGYDPTDIDHYRVLQIFAVATSIQHGDINYDTTPEMIALPENLSEMKEKIKKALESHGLWDESKFGLWAIGEKQ